MVFCAVTRSLCAAGSPHPPLRGPPSPLGKAYKRLAREVDFDARLRLERGGERSVFTYVTESESRSSPMYIGKDASQDSLTSLISSLISASKEVSAEICFSILRKLDIAVVWSRENSSPICTRVRSVSVLIR